MTPLETKAKLRYGLRSLRRTLAIGGVEAAAGAAAHLPLGAIPGFATVAGYWPQGPELDPLPLLQRLAGAGARTCLPGVESPDAPLVFRAWRPGDPLAKDAAGIPAPVAQAPVLRPDLVVIPLLGFDRRGRRLGQGGGHYDRTLAALRAAGPCFALGLAFAGQEVDNLPEEPHDQRLDAILTEFGYIEAGKD